MDNLKIKNKISNSKEQKKKIIFNKYMDVKKSIRLKFQKVKPLTQYEKLVFLHHGKERPATPLDSDQFFESTGNIILLTVYPKSNIDNFEKNIEKLILDNPAKSPFIKTTITERYSKKFKNLAYSHNYMSWSKVGYCSPKSCNLKDLIDCIEIDIFNFSNDYFGISFNLILSSELRNYINNYYRKTSGFNTEEYHVYSYNSKKMVGVSSYNSNIIRRKEIENILIEIKMRAYNFINKYLKLNNSKNNSPISLDIYCSNITDIDNNFYNSYDLFFRKEDLHKDLDILYEKDSKQEFIKSEFLLEYNYRNSINRSSNLILFSESNISNSIFILIEELINIFIKVLCIELTSELNSFITKERNLIDKNFSSSESKFNKLYDSLYREIFRYKMIFNEITFFDDGFVDNSIKNYFNNFEKNYKKLLKKHEIIETASTDKMLISNYKSTKRLAVISIAIAIISIFITIFFEYFKSEKNYDTQLESIYYQLENSSNSNMSILKKINNNLNTIINK